VGHISGQFKAICGMESNGHGGSFSKFVEVDVRQVTRISCLAMYRVHISTDPQHQGD